jgi:hypothetical protein
MGQKSTYPGRRRHKITVGISAQSSEAGVGFGSRMGPDLFLKGLLPFVCAEVTFWIMMRSRTSSGVTSSFPTLDFTRPKHRVLSGVVEYTALLPTGLITFGCWKPAQTCMLPQSMSIYAIEMAQRPGAIFLYFLSLKKHVSQLFSRIHSFEVTVQNLWPARIARNIVFYAIVSNGHGLYAVECLLG